MWTLTLFDAFCKMGMIFAAEAAPPSPADRCLHGPSFICTSAGWSDLNHGTVSPHPDLLPPDPLRAQPNLREWTGRADRPRSSPSSVSSCSQFLLGLGRFQGLTSRWFSLVMRVRACSHRRARKAEQMKAAELNWISYVFPAVTFQIVN